MRLKADISGQLSGLPLFSMPVGLKLLYFFNHNFDRNGFYLNIWGCQFYF